MTGYPYKLLYGFAGSPDGALPEAALLPGPGGSFLGTADEGGAGQCVSSGVSGCGTVYSLAPTGGHYIENTLYRFQGPPSDGAFPGQGALVSDASGNLYGTTFLGGSGSCPEFGNYGCGVVFKLTPTGSGYAESVIYSFKDEEDGFNLASGLVIDSRGALYGVTPLGGGGRPCRDLGNHGCGTVFKLTPTKSGYKMMVLHRFGGGPDGAFPAARMILTSSGALIGTTFRGGQGPCSSYGLGCGTVFELSPAGGKYTESILYSFPGGSGGTLAQGGVIEDGNGVLYGMTVFGGNGPCAGSGDPPGCGVVYSLTPSGSTYVETVIHDFQGSDGARPLGSLFEANGILYGATTAGGSGACGISGIRGCGVVFDLVPSGSGYAENVLHNFGSVQNDGTYPGDPILDQRGVLIGPTFFGGATGLGTIYRIKP
jgi:hypothetical protein